jgi:hypothetical protein
MAHIGKEFSEADSIMMLDGSSLRELMRNSILTAAEQIWWSQGGSNARTLQCHCEIYLASY